MFWNYAKIQLKLWEINQKEQNIQFLKAMD